MQLPLDCESQREGSASKMSTGEGSAGGGGGCSRTLASVGEYNIFS